MHTAEKIQLPLTMTHPGLTCYRKVEMPHPGDYKVAKCPTNARGGMLAVEIDEAINRDIKRCITQELFFLKAEIAGESDVFTRNSELCVDCR